MSMLVVLKPEAEFTSYNARVLGAALNWNEPIVVLLSHRMTDSYQQALACIDGVERVIEPRGIVDPINMAAALIDIIAKYHIHCVVSGDDYLTKQILPRAAASLGVGQISGVCAILPSGELVRSTYAGNVLETVVSLDSIQFVTCRPTSFAPALMTASHSLDLESWPLIELDEGNFGCCLSSEVMAKSVDLAVAPRVIGVGLGVQDDETFAAIEQFAQRFGFVLGASRRIIDTGKIAYDKQIGQSGRSIAPDIYLALGLSGAVQHLAGIRDAKTIIAVNTDPDAPIMAMADHAFVGDVKAVLPALTALLGGI